MTQWAEFGLLTNEAAPGQSITAAYPVFEDTQPGPSALALWVTVMDSAGATLESDYLVERYYDPATGQFLTVDPLVDETGQAYAYAGNDPVNGTDPNGLDTVGICGGVNANLGEFSPSPGACLTRQLIQVARTI